MDRHLPFNGDDKGCACVRVRTPVKVEETSLFIISLSFFNLLFSNSCAHSLAFCLLNLSNLVYILIFSQSRTLGIQTC